MGSGIVTWLLGNGVKVILKETNEKFAEQAKKRVESNIFEQVKKGKNKK
jgi:3-hydroxyacyl-CoA dehydrogenase